MLLAFTVRFDSFLFRFPLCCLCCVCSVYFCISIYVYLLMYVFCFTVLNMLFNVYIMCVRAVAYCVYPCFMLLCLFVIIAFYL